jgi:hypothetical protein
MSVAGKYGGDNPMKYFVRLRTICDISVSFSCGVEEEEAPRLLLKSSVVPYIQILTMKLIVLKTFEKLN